MNDTEYTDERELVTQEREEAIIANPLYRSPDGVPRICGIPVVDLLHFVELLRATWPGGYRMFKPMRTAMNRYMSRVKAEAQLRQTGDYNTKSPKTAELAQELARIDALDISKEEKRRLSVEAFRDNIDMVAFHASVMQGLADGKSEDRRLCAQMLGLFGEKEEVSVAPVFNFNVVVSTEEETKKLSRRVAGAISGD